MSKVYLYSNIILVLICITALILSILDIIVKESGQQEDGCPTNNCTIDAESITAKESKFNRITSKNSNSTLTINTLSNLNLTNARITTIISDNTNINQIINNIDLSNNSLTIGSNKILNFKSFSIFSSDIGTSNLTTNNVSCTTAYISNLSSTLITSSNISGNFFKTTNVSFQDIKGDFVKCTNASFTNVSFQSYTATNLSFINPSITKLNCTNCTISNISTTFNVSVNNIYYKSLQCINMNTNGSVISANTMSFTNLLNKSIIYCDYLETKNINGLQDYLTIRGTQSFINCSNLIRSSNFSSSFILSTNNSINNLYKFGDYTNLLDAYIKNLTCTKLITNDTIFINNLPLNESYSNLQVNNMKYSLNIQTVANTPLISPVNGTSNNSKILINISSPKKIDMTYNSTKTFAFSDCLYIYPGDGYNNLQPNNIELSFSNSSNSPDLSVLLGISIRCIFDTLFKPPSFPFVLKISNSIKDYSIEIISNKNIYDFSTNFVQIISTNATPALINVFKGENNLDFMINVSITCTNVDAVNKKIVFLILPI